MIHPSKINVDKLVGYKIEIYPTEDQKVLIQQIVNTFRSVYNLALEFQQLSYESGEGFIYDNKTHYIT